MLYQHLKGCIMEEENEKIISGGMLLTLLFLFAVWGQFMLYFHGVNSWENLSPFYRRNAIVYNVERFSFDFKSANICETYIPTLCMSEFLDSKEEREKLLSILRRWGGHLYNHYYVEPEKALKFYVLASGYRSEVHFQNLYAFIDLEKASIYHDFGKKQQRDYFLKKAQKRLQYCRNARKQKKDLSLQEAEFTCMILQTVILGDEGKLTAALDFLEKNMKSEKFRDFQSSTPVFTRATIYKAMGREKDFLNELEHLEKIYSQDFHYYSYYNLLSHYEKNKEYKKCILYIESNMKKVLKKETKNILMWDLARIYGKMGEKEKALQIKKTLVLPPAGYKKKMVQMMVL